MVLKLTYGTLTRNACALSTTSSRTAADTARVKLRVKGMTCGSCATTARFALERYS